MRKLSYLRSFYAKRKTNLLKIVIATKLALLLILLPSFNTFGSDVLSTGKVLQQTKVTGTITSAKDGLALPGVSVQEKGTTNGAISDANGKYSLTVQNPNAVLVYSFIGYLPEEKALGGQSVLDVALVEDVKQLEEVVVIGYGTQKRTSVTGAISSVSAKDITQLPVASMQSALQGKAAGVMVTNQGTPGGDPVVRVRGVGSITYAADPLYVIDGIPASNISNFDSRDIESLEVLKDAASTAIYGSRAANGVILVTTKKGKKDGKVRVNVDSYVGTQSMPKTIKLLNTQEYVAYGTALDNAAGIALPYRFSHMDEPIYAGSTQTFNQTNTDWLGKLFHNAMISDNNVSLSTGGEKSNFYASAGYFTQDGIEINTGFKRYSIRLNSDHKISKRVKFGQTLVVSYGDRKNESQVQGRTNIMHAMREAPYIPIENPNNLGGYQAAVSGLDGQDAHNPIEIQNLYTNTTKTTKVFGTLYVEIKLADFLTFKSTAGLDYTNQDGKTIIPIFNDGFNSTTSATITGTNSINVGKTFQNQLTFDKTFGAHTINITAVQEQSPFASKFMSIQGNLPTNTVAELTGLTNQVASGNRGYNTMVSYLGRINYDFKNKYLLSASFRADGSSKFAPGHKWGYYKAGSLGWRLKEEDFLKSVDLISDLKLRGGYGEMGQIGGIGNYDWSANINSNANYVFNNGDQSSASFNAFSNTNLKWETSKMTNIGMDLGLLGNKVTFSVEWFTKTTDNLIINVPYDFSSGYLAAANTNIAKMKNSGIELQGAVQINKGDFKSTLSANISFIRNNIEKLYQKSPIDAGTHQDYGGYDFTRTAEDHSIQSFYGWIAQGLIQPGDAAALAAQPNAKVGDVKFKDTNGDGRITADDRAFLGSYLPLSTYSFNYTGSYKNFDFSVFFQGVYGNKIYNGTKVITQGMLRLFNAGKEVLNSYGYNGITNTDIPRAVSGDPNQNARTSTRFLESGSYLRLKALSLGYTIPLNKITNGNVNQIRVYVTGQNLLTMTKYTGFDPEVGNSRGILTNGIDYGNVPQPRTFLGGIQINF